MKKNIKQQVELPFAKRVKKQEPKGENKKRKGIDPREAQMILGLNKESEESDG